ncbi:MAG TPA: PKD domain-containing protein [Candidatus Limnocylindria bacterium]|jgi:PKD repeat protein|nr:PKD domain-containing protein [Candidatus Limnocylindria bacterium]
MAIAMLGLGLPWGAHVAYAAGAPVLDSVWLETATGPTTAVDEAQTFQVKGTFTDGDAADRHFVLIKIGSTFVETTTMLPFGARSFSLPKVYPDDTPSGTPQDPFTLTVRVQDNSGLVSDIWTINVTLRNVAPTVTSFVYTPSSILDHQTVQANGAFTDPGTKDTFTLSLDWGDGSAAFTQSYLSTDPKTFAASHEYAVAGSYTVSATVTDDDMGVGRQEGPLAVAARNTAPSALVLSGGGVTEGDPATVHGQFVDPDPADTHTVNVQWGDGAATDVTLGAGVLTFDVTHTYASYGTYPITATVADQAATSTQSSMSFTVFRRNHAPADLALSTAGAVAGGSGTLNLTFSDPDPLDWHRVSVTWGDLSVQSASDQLLDAGVFSLETSHVYDAPGTYTVSVVVVDTYGSSVSGTATLEVRARTARELVDDLASLVSSWGLDEGFENSFLTKVRSAQAEFGWGRGNACNRLNALANHVSAQTDKELSLDQADAFWSVLADVNASLGCAQLDRPEVKAKVVEKADKKAADYKAVDAKNAEHKKATKEKDKKH